jgi:hypothetical protein
MRPEGKSNDDNQMGFRDVSSSDSKQVGGGAGVGMTPEDKSGLPVNGGVPATPDTTQYTALNNSKTVPINKSRGTGVQINNGALTAAGGNPAGAGPMMDDDGSGPNGATGDGSAVSYGQGSVASEMAKVTKVSGDKVSGMNYGPSIGRFDNPPAVIKRTGTDESIEDALTAVESRWAPTDTEHIIPSSKDGTPTGQDRIWR